jgi:hypothetical protein
MGKKILVVDKRWEDVGKLMSYLEVQGNDVEYVNCVDGGKDELVNKYDAAVLDLRLPLEERGPSDIYNGMGFAAYISVIYPEMLFVIHSSGLPESIVESFKSADVPCFEKAGNDMNAQEDNARRILDYFESVWYPD